MPKKVKYVKKDAQEYSSVTVTQETEKSTAKGQKIPSQAVQGTSNKKLSVNPHAGKSSYVATKEPGPYGGL